MAEASTIVWTEETPRTAERVLVGITVGCGALFVLLAIFVFHGAGPLWLDSRLGVTGPPYVPAMPIRWIGAGWHEVEHVALLGSPQVVFSGVLVLGVVSFVRRDYIGIVICAFGPAFAGLCSQAFKEVVDRPKSGILSYPSGHTTLAAALAALIVVVAYRLGGARAAAIAAVPAALIPLVVTIAVVRLGWHYPTDAIGGLALGVGVVAGTAVAVPWGFGKIGRTS